MSAWFVFKVNGKHVAVWARSSADGEEKIRREFGDAATNIEYIGFYSGTTDIPVAVDKFIRTGMTPTDVMMISGFLRAFSRM